jgi:hypothetical protein
MLLLYYLDIIALGGAYEDWVIIRLLLFALDRDGDESFLTM